jgi:hypothetical protein
MTHGALSVRFMEGQTMSTYSRTCLASLEKFLEETGERCRRSGLQDGSIPLSSERAAPTLKSHSEREAAADFPLFFKDFRTGR